MSRIALFLALAIPAGCGGPYCEPDIYGTILISVAQVHGAAVASSSGQCTAPHCSTETSAGCVLWSVSLEGDDSTCTITLVDGDETATIHVTPDTGRDNCEGDLSVKAQFER